MTDGGVDRSSESHDRRDRFSIVKSKIIPTREDEMKRSAASLCIAGILGVLPSLAIAQNRVVQERVVESGHSQTIQSIMAVDPACHALSLGQAALLDPPKLGRVTMEQGREYPGYLPANPRSPCNTRKVPAMHLIYTTAPGAVGEDTFAIEYVDPFGIPVRQRFHVVVR